MTQPGNLDLLAALREQTEIIERITARLAAGNPDPDGTDDADETLVRAPGSRPDHHCAPDPDAAAASAGCEDRRPPGPHSRPTELRRTA